MIHEIWWDVVNVALNRVFISHSGTFWSSQTDYARITHVVKVSLLGGVGIIYRSNY